MFQSQHEEMRHWRRKFQNHKDNSKQRNAQFLLTFDEWFKIWIDSGFIAQRGRGSGKYCMARFGDKGDYVLGNVKIISYEENEAELWARPETLQKIRKALVGNSYAKGYKHTEEACIRMSNNSPTAKQVICLDDGHEFKSIKAAANFYGIRIHNLEAALSGKPKRISKTLKGLSFKLK